MIYKAVKQTEYTNAIGSRTIAGRMRHPTSIERGNGPRGRFGAQSNIGERNYHRSIS
jgi:hypothetical protein